jgi:hypothetical protein
MARKHKHEEHQNHERWVVSFADMMTLLFALFVVLYALGLDKLDPVARSIAFAFHFDGDGKTKMEGIFDGGQLGGGLLDGPPLVNAQSGPMREWLEKTLKDEFAEVSGSSLEVQVTNDAIHVSSKLSAFFEPDSVRLKAGVQNLLNELVQKSAPYAGTVRMRIEAPDERIGTTANRTAKRTERLCLDRLQFLIDLMRTQPAPVDMMRVEVAFRFAALPGPGTWEDRGFLRVMFTNSP